MVDTQKVIQIVYIDRNMTLWGTAIQKKSQAFKKPVLHFKFP